jgi:hypothetical protein
MFSKFLEHQMVAVGKKVVSTLQVQNVEIDASMLDF